jgi:hypothetical protein
MSHTDDTYIRMFHTRIHTASFSPLQILLAVYAAVLGAGMRLRRDAASELFVVYVCVFVWVCLSVLVSMNTHTHGHLLEVSHAFITGTGVLGLHRRSARLDMEACKPCSIGSTTRTRRRCRRFWSSIRGGGVRREFFRRHVISCLA